MIRKIFGRKAPTTGGWQPGDPPEMGKGLEQPIPRACINPVRRLPGTNQVEEVRAAIESTIRRDGYLALSMPERVFINVYFGMSFFVAGPENGWKSVSPRDWATVVVGLTDMGEHVAAQFVEEMVKYRLKDVRNAEGETDHFEGLRDIMLRWSKVDFDRAKVLQRYLERDYWGTLVR